MAKATQPHRGTGSPGSAGERKQQLVLLHHLLGHKRHLQTVRHMPRNSDRKCEKNFTQTKTVQTAQDKHEKWVVKLRLARDKESVHENTDRVNVEE